MKTRDDRPAGTELDAGEEYRPSDEQLGVGEAERGQDQELTAVAGSVLQDLLQKDPAIAAAVEQLVADRLHQAAQAVPGTVPPAASVDMAGLVTLLVTALDKHSLSMGSQQPGHVKPIPAEEVEARAGAYIDMSAMIAVAVEQQARPEYLLTEDFHAADFLWAKGDVIVWYGPPNTEMVPQNQVASAIFAKMQRWIGGEQTHIADQVAEAFRDRGKALPPTGHYLPVESEHGSLGETYRQGGLKQVRLAERVDTPRRQVGPTRIAGTVMPEGPPGAVGGPVRMPGTSRAETGTIMPVERPSSAQS